MVEVTAHTPGHPIVKFFGVSNKVSHLYENKDSEFL